MSRTIIDENGQEREKIITLTDQEQISLMQFELLKTELITMCRYVNSGNVKYAFPPDKQGRMHDDRIYAFGLLCWRLAQRKLVRLLATPARGISALVIIFASRSDMRTIC